MDIYQHFLGHGLTTSKRHFSSVWLNRAENYLCLRAKRGPSVEVLVQLFQALWSKRRIVLAARVATAILWRKPPGDQ